MILLSLLFIYFLVVQGEAKFITFSALYPDKNIENSTLFIRGNNCNLSLEKGYAMKKSNDEWNTALLCEQNSSVIIKLFIDDKIGMVGSQQYKTNESLIKIYPSFYPKQNQILDSAQLYSQILKNQRKVSIYYPPSYFENTFKKYEILLMQDGQNLFSIKDSEYGKIWDIKPTLDNLIIQGQIQQIIVIGIWNTKQRCDQYTNTFDVQQNCGGNADLYLNFIQQELIQWVQNRYLNDRSMKVYHIGGGSYGGLLSCYGIFTRNQKFKKGICMSSSFWWDSQNFVNSILPHQKINKSIKVYMDSGEDNKVQTINVFNYLQKIGYENKIKYYYDKGGYHDITVLGKRFYIPLKWLFGKEKEKNQNKQLFLE